MRAGLLRERAIFYASTAEQTKSGFKKKTATELATVKCYRKRMASKDAVTAGEEQNQGTVTLLVRVDKRLNQATIFEYEGERYKITQRLKNIADNTWYITGTKINS